MLAAAGLLAGCSTVTLPIDVALTVAEERRLTEVGADAKIKINILGSFAQSDTKGLLTHVSSDVYQGRVMLTGAVEKSDARTTAEELVRRIEGVREVINEIQVSSEGGFKATMADLTIETKLKAKLVTANNVSSINYRWRAVNGVVYFIGLAQNHDELEKVLAIARDTEGVRKVVSYVRIKPQEGS